MASMSRAAEALLPDDIMYEILLWTDPHIFRTIRCVCKQWRHLLLDPNFRKNHQKRFRGIIVLENETYTLTNIFFLPDPHLPPSRRGPLPSLNMMPAKLESVYASSPRGLLLCSVSGQKLGQSMYLGKPTTNEWKPIEKCRTNYKGITRTMKWLIAVASTTPLRFKIVRIMMWAGSEKTLRLEVVDSDAWGEWKEVVLAADDSITYFSSPTLVQDEWLCWFRDQATKIVCLNIWSEVVGKVSLPAKTGGRVLEGLSEIDGRLGLISKQGTVVEFWKMHGLWVGKDQSWEKQGTLKLQHRENLISHASSSIVDGVVLTSRIDGPNKAYLQWYNYKGGCYIDGHRYAVNLHQCRTPWNLFFFQSDYFPCNLM